MLERDLARLDGRPYPAYKDLRGKRYVASPFTLTFEHIQGDPFAAPSRLCVFVPPEVCQLPDSACHSEDARRACADFLHRRIGEGLRSIPRVGGSGKSGRVEILGVGQEVLERTAVIVDEDGSVTLRLFVGLPAGGRRILGRAAAALVGEHIPDSIVRSLEGVDVDAMNAHVRIVEDQVAMRDCLASKGLIAFVANESVLPRASGVDDRPLPDAIPFRSPPSLQVTLECPHQGKVEGMGVPEGITLIVGGGYHGKSTLLSALARGVYDHVPGDGRHGVVTTSKAVWIRAEDGRSVQGVNLTPFITNLPLGRNTESFETADASGSTSQAAAVMEALEVGAQTLLIDEDTAATNFMIRDARMRQLIPPDREPITPYLDRVEQLARDEGVSSVLVIGGAGDYLDVADTVIQMDGYRAVDLGREASELVQRLPLSEPPGATDSWTSPTPRRPRRGCLDASRGRKRERVRSVKTRAIEFGSEEIDVSLLYQLVDPAQARMIGDALLYLSKGACDGSQSIAELVEQVERLVEDRGLLALSDRTYGDRARARSYEIAAALNRLRTLRISED